MEPRFRWGWYTDGSGEHVRVAWYTDDRPEGVEVCRMLPGRTDDKTGCVLRAVAVCDAMALHAKTQAEAISKAAAGPPS